MTGQMTIWDIEGVDNDLTECVRRGMFDGANIRICAMYALEDDRKKRAQFLAAEYGQGGRTITTKDGKRGLVDFSKRGIRISHFDSEEEKSYSWLDAEKEIGKLISEDRYLSEKDRKTWAGLKHRPYPAPRLKYP